MILPERFANACELEAFIAQPSDELIAMMKRLDGDIMILGVAGKMGVTMAMLAANAIKAAGVEKRVYGVARFSDDSARSKLDAGGVKTDQCAAAGEKYYFYGGQKVRHPGRRRSYLGNECAGAGVYG